MPFKVCRIFPVRPPINVFTAMSSLGRSSFGASMTFSCTDPFTYSTRSQSNKVR